jgi:hypothetical protein
VSLRGPLGVSGTASASRYALSSWQMGPTGRPSGRRPGWQAPPIPAGARAKGLGEYLVSVEHLDADAVSKTTSKNSMMRRAPRWSRAEWPGRAARCFCYDVFGRRSMGASGKSLRVVLERRAAAPITIPAIART